MIAPLERSGPSASLIHALILPRRNLAVLWCMILAAVNNEKHVSAKC